ncbi:hypothetical protein CNR22_22845 [Sphingobacteriaceae bacterium]|nr:hypothetical protein CNR22_22845 [Sphingobacteriaceae bacterium]
MDVKKSVKEYFDISAAKVHSVLILPSKKLSPDDIHRLRVHIKKIRALVSLRTSKTGNKSSKSLRLIKGLFAMAGALREVQLRAQAIQKKNIDNKLSNYLYYLNLRIHYEKKNFKKELQVIKDAKPHLALLKQQIKQVGKKQIKAFEKEGDDRKQEILKKAKVSSEELHELRKQLKKELYIHEASGDILSVNAGDKKISQMLGEWHDCHVMAADIKKDLKAVKLPASEVKLLKKISNDYITQAKSLQSLLINKLLTPTPSV